MPARVATVSYIHLDVYKRQVYASSLSEQPLKEMASTFAQHHKQHFDALQNYLNSHQ